MGIAIVITSGKGGVGKTTTSANLGTALALLGKKVCLVDTDIGLRNLDVVMGLENRIIFDLIDVIEGNCRLHQALIKDKRFDELFLLPAAQTKDKEYVKTEDIRKLIFELKVDFDYIIIDCPAGIERGFKNAISGADQAIVVTTPEHTAVRDADRVIGLLEQNLFQKPKLIINRMKTTWHSKNEMLDTSDICSVLSIDLLGIVPDDEKAIHYLNAGEPIVMDPKALSAIAFRNIARRIIGESVPLMSFEKNKGFWKKLKKFIGIG
jgi:septum site-determining protein MinD